MESSRIYYGDEIVNVKELIESNTKRFIKLEYYGTKKVTYDNFIEYGIEVTKKEYINKVFVEETSNVNSIAKSEEEIEELVSVLKRNKVTPIGLVDTINDLIRKQIAD